MDMKLIFAIVRDEDSGTVMSELNKEGYSVTKMSSTGGFLRSGNTTLMIGTDEDKVSHAIEVIKGQCGSRKQIIATSAPMVGMPSYTSFPISVDVGGATIFVLDVERFEKI